MPPLDNVCLHLESAALSVPSLWGFFLQGGDWLQEGVSQWVAGESGKVVWLLLTQPWKPQLTLPCSVGQTVTTHPDLSQGTQIPLLAGRNVKELQGPILCCDGKVVKAHTTLMYSCHCDLTL